MMDTVTYDTDEKVLAALEAGELDEAEAVDLLEQIDADRTAAAEVAVVDVEDEPEVVPSPTDAYDGDVPPPGDDDAPPTTDDVYVVGDATGIAGPGDVVRIIATGQVGPVERRGSNGTIVLLDDDRPKRVYRRDEFVIV